MRNSSWRAHAVLWLACAAVILAAHVPFLGLPYFWDEAGYYVPAARELAEQGRLLPRTTAANPHPPLLAAYLAIAWKLFGFRPLVTRLAMALVAATAIYAFLLLAAQVLPAGEGLWAAALLAASPLFFAQSTLAHLDVAATAGTLLAVHFLLRGRVAAYLLAASLLCLTRETGAVVVLVLACWRRRPLLLLPLAPLAGWFIFLRWGTGHWLGDPGFVAYNVWPAIHPARVLVTLLRRLHYLLVADFRWVLALPLVWVWARRAVPLQARLLAGVLLTQVLVVSLFGGAVLDRYLLPAVALFYLLALQSWERWRIPQRHWALAALLVAEMGCWFWNPPYPFPYEENLAYVDFIRLHQAAAEGLALLPPGARVLTAWPATDELTRPELGYVSAPARVVPLEDFSEESFGRVRAGDFDALLLYSREWQPRWNLLEKWPLLQQMARRIYGRRPPAKPEWVRWKFNLNSRGTVYLRGQWMDWLERGDLRRSPILHVSRRPAGATP